MKDMSSLGGKSTGWEEPSPPAQRRNMPNYDDGTSLWGAQHPRPTIQGISMQLFIFVIHRKIRETILHS